MLEDQIPEVAGETPQDPDIVGTATPEEMALLTGLRQKGNQMSNEIGNLEIQKARLIGAVAQVEAQGNQVLQGISSRLGLTPEQQWQLLPDGRVRIVKPWQNGG